MSAKKCKEIIRLIMLITEKCKETLHMNCLIYGKVYILFTVQSTSLGNFVLLTLHFQRAKIYPPQKNEGKMKREEFMIRNTNDLMQLFAKFKDFEEQILNLSNSMVPYYREVDKYIRNKRKIIYMTKKTKKNKQEIK